MRCSGSALRGQQADRDVGDRLEVAGQVEPALAGHHHVEDDDVEGEAAHGGARARGVGGGGDAEAVLEQVARQQIADALIVVDDQDVRGVVGQRFHCASMPRRRCICRYRCAVRGGCLDRLGQQRLDQRPLLLGDHVEQEARRHARRCRRRPGPGPGRRAWPAGCRGGRARAAPFSVAYSSRWRRSRSPAFCTIQPSSTSCLSTRARLCLVIFRISSRSATRKPGCRLTKCSTR